MKKPKVILIAAQSLDGYIAKSTADKLDWVPKQDHILYRNLTIKIKNLIVGGNTFKLLPQKAKEYRYFWVLTKNKFKDKNAESIAGKPQKILKILATKGIKQVAVIGGGSIYTQFLSQGLVDELVLSIIPIFLGNGIRLFDTTKQTLSETNSSEKNKKQSTVATGKNSFLHLANLQFNITKVERYREFVRVWGKKSR